MSSFRPFSGERSRLLFNLRRRYDAWFTIVRERVAIPCDLRRKTVGPYEYLYRIDDRRGTARASVPGM